MNDKVPRHRSYLLRMWEEGDQIESPWRIVLVNPHTGERWGFSDLQRLLRFLQAQMDEHSTEPSA